MERWWRRIMTLQLGDILLSSIMAQQVMEQITEQYINISAAARFHWGTLCPEGKQLAVLEAQAFQQVRTYILKCGLMERQKTPLIINILICHHEFRQEIRYK
jgi:hypothetical protein